MNVGYGFPTGVNVDPNDPWNISWDQQVKHNKLMVHDDILVVNEENQLRMVFTIKCSISTVILVEHENNWSGNRMNFDALDS